MARIVFYTHAPLEKLRQVEFYSQDIDALRALGHEVRICTKLWQIPLKFDAMFIWWWTHALVPVWLCRIFRRPCIVTGTFDFRFPDGFDGKDYFRRPRWQRLLIKLATKHCTLNLFVNQLELQQCSKYFGLNNVGYMPHCVSDVYLQGPSTNRTKALFSIAWSQKQNLMRKGIPELLEAICILKDRGQQVELYLAGLEGDGRAFLLERIAQLDIQNRVHYLGALTREEKVQKLRELEIYVQPSHYEGFGLAILESMGSGACVIVRDVGGVKEVVADCGVYVPSPDAQSIAFAIEKVLNDDEFRRTLQTRAVERARSVFTFDKKVETLGGFLRELSVEPEAHFKLAHQTLKID